MIRVKLTYPFSWPILKQTPLRSGEWGDCKFYLNQEIPECDYWIVFEGLENQEETKCNLENTLLITAEPPAVKTYNASFVNQFNWVLTCHDFSHKNVIHSQQGLNWMVGGRYNKAQHSWEAVHTKDYDELSSITVFKKDKLMSVIVSNKGITKGHRDRLKFIEAAKSHFGSALDVFGVGFNEVPDKWDALYPYRYHLALENSIYKDYWTEKVSDSFLAGAYPFYYGCPNINDYFSPQSFTYIDIADERKSLNEITRRIEQSKYEQSTDFIRQSRDLILNKYNLMSVIDEFCTTKLKSSFTKEPITLYPEGHFKQNMSPLKKVKSFLFR